MRLEDLAGLTIGEVVRLLAEFDYGLLTTEGIVTGDEVDDVDQATVGVVQHPWQTLDNEAGNCWDMSTLIDWLPAFGHRVSCWYLEGGKGGETHTWPTITVDDATWVLETAWKPHVGIHRFADERTMLIEYGNLVAGEIGSPYGHVIYRADLTNVGGISYPSFMRRMVADPDLRVISTGVYERTFVLPWRASGFVDDAAYRAAWAD